MGKEELGAALTNFFFLTFLGHCCLPLKMILSSVFEVDSPCLNIIDSFFEGFWFLIFIYLAISRIMWDLVLSHMVSLIAMLERVVASGIKAVEITGACIRGEAGPVITRSKPEKVG